MLFGFFGVCVATGSVFAEDRPSKPEMEYPRPGQVLDFGRSYMFKARAHEGVQYRYRVYVRPPGAGNGPQDCEGKWDQIWDNKPGKFPGSEGFSNDGAFAIHPGHPAHGKVVAGGLRIKVNARANNSESESLEFCIHIKSSEHVKSPEPAKTVAPLAMEYPQPQQKLGLGGSYMFKVRGADTKRSYRISLLQDGTTRYTQTSHNGEFGLHPNQKEHRLIGKGLLRVVIEERGGDNRRLDFGVQIE